MVINREGANVNMHKKRELSIISFFVNNQPNEDISF
tara:strand:+ start:414 stop:521 length:108 start_codon:yes stop_codon:yes gene_type:complete